MACLALVHPLSAENYYVDPETGNNKFNGLSAAVDSKSGPLKTIEHAIALAQPGDTIHLAPGRIFKEQAGFYNKSGEPGKPITLDGHGAVICGSVPLDVKDWKEVAPELYSADGESLVRNTWRPKDLKNKDWIKAWVDRFSFVFDGKLNRMNHSVKAPGVPWKVPAELKPGEWTYQEPDTHLLGRYFIRIDPSKTLQDYKIELPMIVSGVQISGTVSYLTIKNLTVTNVCNDGFALTTGNEHGSRVHHIVYENIRSIDCCDDGLSAHGDCEVSVDGFESIGNSTGIASMGCSVNRHVIIRDTHGEDLIFLSGSHVIRDSVVECHGLTAPVWLESILKNEAVSLKLDNVLLIGGKGYSGRASTIRINERCTLEARRVTFTGVSFLAMNGSVLSLRECVLAGGASFQLNILSKAAFYADHNFYDLETVRMGNRSFSMNDFDAWRTATGQDTGSVWAKVKPDFTEKYMMSLTSGNRVGFDADAFKREK